jgi:hypothetical protein
MSTDGIYETYDDQVFIFTGDVRAVIPDDVVCVRVDPSVTSIPFFVGRKYKKLTEVELCEGLVEIGERSFMWCDQSITKINIPNSVRRICDEAFSHSLRTPIRLHDGIESIGGGAFDNCIFTNFRVPPLITEIPWRLLTDCRSMFSLELPKIVTEIGYHALFNCYCLRNVAIPPNAVFNDNKLFDKEYQERTDLYLLFDSIAEIISELQHRFDGLPIHELVYYHSYNENVLQNLLAEIDLTSGQRRTLRSKLLCQRRTLRSLLNPTGNQQDCLGMTPLHILACSSVHDLKLYRVIVEKYPTNLIIEDRWGALPLLYAFWGAAPAEIIQFLLDSYQSLYPDHVFNWTIIVETMGRCDTPKENIENMLHVRQMHFPKQPLDWEYLLDKFALPSRISFEGAPFQELMQFLFMCGMSDRVEALPFKVWRDYIKHMIHTADFKWKKDNSVILRSIQEKLIYFEDELLKLKEATTILELVLWKVMSCRQKKVKTDESSIHSQCRVTCGASVVITHVLPFLITTKDNKI